MKAKKIWPEIEIFQIFTDNIDNYVEIWIKTEPKKRRKQSLENNMKSYTHTILQNLLFLTQEQRKFDLNSKGLILKLKIREFKIQIIWKSKINKALYAWQNL